MIHEYFNLFYQPKIIYETLGDNPRQLRQDILSIVALNATNEFFMILRDELKRELTVEEICAVSTWWEAQAGTMTMYYKQPDQLNSLERLKIIQAYANLVTKYEKNKLITQVC